MRRLPFEDRWLWDTPALSSSPGHIPTQEERFFWEGKVAALAHTSAALNSPLARAPPPAVAQRLDAGGADTRSLGPVGRFALQ
jgi:hypothetical protein